MLITNLLGEQEYPASELIPLYHERWEQELVFDEQKTHQDPRRASKPAHLRSESPAGVVQELYALSLAHFVTRALMFQAATSANLDPDRLSFNGCFQILQCRLPECRAESAVSLAAWYAALLDELRDLNARTWRVDLAFFDTFEPDSAGLTEFESAAWRAFSVLHRVAGKSDEFGSPMILDW